MASLHYALDLHLAFLLYQEDSVVVPGMGTFSVRRYGAEIQLPAGLILPPARRVSFSPDASGNPSVLTAHLAKVEGLATEVALEQVALVVREWQRVLERGDRLTLLGVGSLRRAESSWVFKASLEANFLADSYGLPMFRMDLLASADAFNPERVERPAPRVRSWQAAAVVAGALGLAAIGGTKDDFRGMVQSASVRTELTGWWTAQRANLKSFQLASTEWLSSAAEFTSSLVEDATAGSESDLEPTAVPAPSEAVKRIEPAAAVKTEAPEATEAAPAPKQRPMAEMPASEGSEAVGAQYALVVGAFEDAENASRLAERLRAAGFPAKVLKSKVGLKKVALRTFADANSARQAKAELKSDFPAIWIYHE